MNDHLGDRRSNRLRGNDTLYAAAFGWEQVYQVFATSSNERNRNKGPETLIVAREAAREETSSRLLANAPTPLQVSTKLLLVRPEADASID